MKDDSIDSSKPTSKSEDSTTQSTSNESHDVKVDASRRVPSKPIQVAQQAEQPRETNGDARSDSEAETVVLPGKEDAPPGSSRKTIKHEGNNDAIADFTTSKEMTTNGTNHESKAEVKLSSKSKRTGQDTTIATEANNSSNLSSAKSTPGPDRAGSESAVSRAKQSHDSDAQGKDSSHRKRKARVDDQDEGVAKRRQKLDESTGSDRRDGRKASNVRSESPPTRQRNRTLSQSTNPAGVQKRRKPPPLHVASRHKGSEEPDGDSEDSGSVTHGPPHLRRLVSTDQSVLSPAKMPHKKLRDKNGRTWLARACAAAEVDSVVARLRERPEDLDIADNAGNTPLQIAALEGNHDIVKVLLDAGCDIRCRNIDMDTPLIDAVENGHLEVIRLLLKHGADPRAANAKGEEPLDLLDAEDENYRAIKDAIEKAKEKDKRRRPSEEQQALSRDGQSGKSPRESPSLQSARSPPPPLPTSRRRTARSEATRNDLLWVTPTPETLRERAGMGDSAGVNHILSMRPIGDIEAVLAAAKGGHEVCLELIIAMGKPKHDPEPLASYKTGYNTPMLAAIGRGNLRVIQLLLDQHDFNPTRRLYRNMTYHEIAKDRAGLDWQEEYDVLKTAYDKFKGRNSNGSSPNSSRTSQAQRDHKKSKTDHTSTSPLRPSKKLSQDAVKDGVSRKKLSTDMKISRPRQDKDREASESTQHGKRKHLRVPQKAASRDASVAVSDRETSPLAPTSDKKTNRSLSDAELHEKVAPKRKRLISGKALRDDQDKKRRETHVSAELSPSSQEHGKAKSASIALPVKVKREESKEGTKIGGLESAKKRTRPSASPSEGNSPNLRKSPDVSKKVKRPRLDPTNQSAPSSTSSGPARVANMASTSNSTSSNPASNAAAAPVAFMGASHAASGKDPKASAPSAETKSSPTNSKPSTAATEPKPSPTSEVQTKRPSSSSSAYPTENASHSEDREIEDTKPHSESPQTRKDKEAESSTESTNPERKESSSSDHWEKERLEREEAERVAREREKEREAERQRVEEAERKAKKEREEEARQEEARQEQARQEQARQEQARQEQARQEQAREEQAREEQAREEQAREEEEVRQQEEARRKEELRLEEEARQREEARKQEEARQEEARQEEARQEEARQAERQRAEQAKQQAERERLRKEEQERQERRRAEQEARERLARIRKQEEEERRRREILPNGLMKAVEMGPDAARQPIEIAKWLPLFTAATWKLDPECEEQARDEQWLTNLQAAPILGITDLDLSQCGCFHR